MLLPITTYHPPLLGASWDRAGGPRARQSAEGEGAPSEGGGGSPREDFEEGVFALGFEAWVRFGERELRGETGRIPPFKD